MKKFLLLLILLTGAGVNSHAQDYVRVDGVQYYLTCYYDSDDVEHWFAEVDMYDGFETDEMTIPETITYNGTEYPVQRIYLLPKNITKVTIPGTITHFSSYSFNYCTELKTIVWEIPYVFESNSTSVLEACPSDITLYCAFPQNYKNANVWKQIASNIHDIVELDGYEKYYIRNVATGKYLGCDNDWGTQASLVEHPEYVYLIPRSDGTYRILTQVSNGSSDHYFNGSYMDGLSTPLTISQSGDYSYIGDATGYYFYGYDGSSNIITQWLSKSSANARWEFLTEADLRAEMLTATEDSPVDATGLLLDPNFGRNNVAIDYWNDAPAVGGENNNMCAEHFNKTFDTFQTLIDLPNGMYRVTVQGFYREGGHGPSVNEELRQSDSEHHYATFYANSERIPLMSIFDAAGQNGTVGVSTSFGYVPNTMAEASSYFMAGLYKQQVDVEVTDGLLRVGIQKRTTVSRDWTCFDNFTITYLGKKETPAPQYDKGDVNLDGKVNGTDLVALANIILGKFEESVTADVNGDGKVNGTDLVALANIILGRASAPRRAPQPVTASGSASLCIEDFTIQARQEATMTIDLNNADDELTLVQFDLALPAGLSIKKVGEDLDIDMCDRTSWRKHSLEANATDGGYRFLLYSGSNALISGTEGGIITVTLVADDTFTGGNIVIDNTLLVTPDQTEIEPASYEYWVGEAPTPSTASLCIEDFTIQARQEATMTIDLTNPDDELTLVQFDLALPTGLSIKTVGEDLDIDMCDRTSWRKHSLEANANDGGYRFLLYSGSNALISGTEGGIIAITLVADNTFTGGNIVIDHTLLVTPDQTEIEPAKYEYEITIPTAITALETDGAAANRIFNLSGQRLMVPQKGINIINGKKVLVK